jgi:ABC-type sugar transport system ATPase subunit
MLGGAFDDAEIRLRSKQRMRTSAGGSAELGPPALKLRNWRVPRSDICRINAGPIDIEIRDSEILGLFGPLGAGKTELLQSLFGLYGGSCSGECWMKGKLVAPFSKPAAAIRRGLALVSAERQKEGVVPQLSVLENMMLGHHRKDLSWWKIVLNRRAARQLCERLIEELGIQTTGPDQTIASLSGGNQQKVLLARAMVNSPRILLLDEPTRGIDVGAKRDVYRWVRATAAQGAAVIVSSLEELELLGLAHRILVLRDGRQLTVLDASKTDEHELLTLAAGGSLH